MEEKGISKAQEMVGHAMKRVAIKLYGTQIGYTIVLKSKIEASLGNIELKKAFDELDQSLKAVNMDSCQYFHSILFLDAISEIEIYFSRLIQIIVKEYPEKIGSTNFKLSEVINADSLDDLITRASDEFINKLMYKKPMDYLESFCEVLSIDKNKFKHLWPVFVEAKARRDLGVHNSWICNSTYLRKMKEANIDTDAKEGDLMIPDEENYMKNKVVNLVELVLNIFEEVIAKHSRKKTPSAADQAANI